MNGESSVCILVHTSRCAIHGMLGRQGGQSFGHRGFWQGFGHKTTFRVPEMHIMSKTINHEKLCLKIVYSYIIEVADSESDLCLCNKKSLVLRIFAFYHLQ